MNEQTVKEVASELAGILPGNRFGRVFALSKNRFVIDMRLRDGRFLFLSVEPQSPRIYLIRRGLRQLEKSSIPDPAFAAVARKYLANSEVEKVEKPEGERVVKIVLWADSELHGSTRFTLVVQLTGRSSNLFLLDKEGRIMDSLKAGNGAGQEVGESYLPPAASPEQRRSDDAFDKGDGGSISDALSDFYAAKEEKERRVSAFRSAESALASELRKKKRLKKALLKDLEDHGQEEKWKRLGDLLLANTANAKRVEGGFLVNDYFTEGSPEIEVPAEARHSVSETAEKYFRKYAKARNARTAIAERLSVVEKAISELETRLEDLLKAFKAGDEEAFENLAPEPPAFPKGSRKRSEKTEHQGVRKFVSADGFEILVGKRSKDNDQLTFRIARSLDTWMHAADYPGSHVVIRNPQRKEVPHSTLIDAARLAAFYSKARGESKAAVHYTLRKFVHKPKGAKPGLVSLADFKTILVEPGFPEGVGD